MPSALLGSEEGSKWYLPVMCESTSKPWTQQKSGSWVATDMDGWTMRVSQNKEAWHWTVRPPGGGYDLYSGDEADLSIAQRRAEAALQRIHEEIRKSSPGQGPKK